MRAVCAGAGAAAVAMCTRGLSEARECINPFVLDLSRPDEELRVQARKALQQTLSPMLLLEGHGIETHVQRVLQRVNAEHDCRAPHSPNEDNFVYVVADANNRSQPPSPHAHHHSLSIAHSDGQLWYGRVMSPSPLCTILLYQ